MNIKQKLALIRVMLYFNAILRKGKISKAAEENGIKQGNLSHLITDFEKSSGILLLQRSNQGVIPTPRGLKISRLTEQLEQSLRELEKAVQNIRAFMNEERIETMVAHYRSIVEQYIWKMPDILNLPITKDEYNLIAENIPEEIEDNYRRYNESYKYPMPFFIGTPSMQNGALQLNWDSSYDFNAEDIVYTVELARDYQFRQVLYRQEHVVLPVAQAESPGAGQYFIRVRATNASGYTQDAFDYYVIDTGKVYGVKCFYIQPDGTVVEDIYEE